MMSSVLDTTFEEPVNVRMFNQQLQINLETQGALGSARTRCNTVDEGINREILREGQTLQEVRQEERDPWECLLGSPW